MHLASHLWICTQEDKKILEATRVPAAEWGGVSQGYMRERNNHSTSKRRTGIISKRPGRIFQVKGMVSSTARISERNMWVIEYSVYFYNASKT